MERGEVVKWRVGVGDPIDDMEVTCEVRTAELTDDPADGEKILEIEAHEDGFLAAILVAEGDMAAPDEAIAVICESSSDVDAFADISRDLARLHVEPATFAWQAYLKAGQTARACSNS